MRAGQEIAPVGRTQSEGFVGLRWQAVFGCSDYLKWIESTRRVTGRGAGR